MMNCKLSLCLLPVILTIVFCEETETQSPVLKSDENVNKTEQINIGNAVNEFGYKLLLTMMQLEKDDNVVLSPTSIGGLLAMTLLGTVGKTYNELVATLGFSKDVIENRKHHEQFGDLLLQLNSNGSFSKTILAEAMFVDAGTAPRTLFREYLARVYKGDVTSVDFKQAALVKDTINKWVSSHTQGKLENFLIQPLPQETKVVLLSAIYFSGQWLQPFSPTHTMKMVFRKPANEVISDQMLNIGSFNYVLSSEHGCHMIALPYNDSTTIMYAIKPIFPNVLSLTDLMNRLNYTQIDQLINQMKKQKLVIRFPKMDLHRKVKLEKALKALGVQSLLKPGEANFALMVDSNTVTNRSEEDITQLKNYNEVDREGLQELINNLPNPGMHVDSVLHDVKLTINEYGTEAVAATAGILARSAQLFYLDSPFYLFIRNEQTKLVTFSAVIYDPTA